MTDVAEIVQRLSTLEARVTTAELLQKTAEKERDEYRALYLETMERCRKLELGLFAQKSERLADAGPQLSLGVLSMMLDERKRVELEEALALANAEQPIKEHTRKKPTGLRISRDSITQIGTT